ncbi:MAG: hypothetical protein LBE31_00170 [Deltaproteobacteria bacterium]|jgi:hypothetical protein|nr:hypothetical protein [Deltaproteobacteria bacterium]
MSKYKNLTDAEVQRISEKYFAERETKSRAQNQPSIVFVGAQPGAEKKHRRRQGTL